MLLRLLGSLQKSKTHWEASKLVTEWILERDGQKLVTARQVRSLADGGKTQIVDTHVQTSDTISDSHAVMIQQP
jgi:ABC-type Fe3+ transport system substrate-binding protein